MDTLEIVTERLHDLGDVYTRMDETKDLVYWDDNPYQLVKPDGKTTLDDAISVTPNSPKVLALYVISDLINGQWQTVVEGRVTDRQAHYIEQFIEDNLLEIDDLLGKQREPGLFETQCNRVCIRSWIGARLVIKIKDGRYHPECLALDMRWTPFDDDWVCPIYYRSKRQIQKEYPDVDVSGIKGKVVVADYWDSEKNEVWIGGNDLSTPGGKLVRQQENTLGYSPFVIVIPSSGFELRDEGYLKHRGEDLLFLNKGIYKEYARALSLEATAGYAGVYPSYEYETGQMDSQAAETPPRLDETKKVPPGELHQLVPRGNVNQAFVTSRQDIQKMMSEGGPISPRAYASPPSAIAISAETELMRVLRSAQVKALQSFREQLSRMIIDQASRLKIDLEVGREGKRNTYSADKLGDPKNYAITCKLMTKNKRQEIANLALFTATAGHLPLSIRLKDILQADDPDGIMRELEIERARQADPALGLFEMALRYAEEAEDIEDDVEADAKRLQSKMLTERGVAIIKQRMQPQPLPEEAAAPKVEEPKAAQNILPAILGNRMQGQEEG